MFKVRSITKDYREAAALCTQINQGYTAPLIVQESRVLQVSIFETIQRNLVDVDFSSILPDIMLIADEVDAQLTQCVESFLKAQAAQLAAPA